MPNPIDIHVGRRIRIRRHELGVTQSELAENLGVTFQQLQKYENAANRVSASKLFAIAKRLNTPVAWFFEGLGEAASEPDTDTIGAFAVTDGALDVARAWLAIAPKPRLRLRDLAVAMAEPVSEIKAAG